MMVLETGYKKFLTESKHVFDGNRKMNFKLVPVLLT